MIVYVLRTEPIDELAELYGVWPTREQAIDAAVKLDPALEGATWKATDDDDPPGVVSWWAEIRSGCLCEYTDWVVEAVEYHP